MNNDKLQEIGAKLNINENDLKGIKKEKQKDKSLYPITGAIISILSILLGYLLGKNAEPKLVSEKTGKTYPYSKICFGIPLAFGFSSTLVGLILALKIIKSRTKYKKLILTTIVVTLIASILGFIIAFKMAQPVHYYHHEIDYGVYSIGK